MGEELGAYFWDCGVLGRVHDISLLVLGMSWGTMAVCMN